MKMALILSAFAAMAPGYSQTLRADLSSAKKKPKCNPADDTVIEQVRSEIPAEDFPDETTKDAFLQTCVATARECCHGDLHEYYLSSIVSTRLHVRKQNDPLLTLFTET